jgi:protein ImuA
MPDRTNHNQTVQHLAQQLRRFERTRGRGEQGNELLSTGIPALDDLLPERGIRRGTLIEWLSENAGGGAGTLAFAVAAHVVQANGAFVVIDQDRSFYPPAASRRGIDLDRVVVVHPPHAGDALWALEQSLRCRGVAVVVCWLDRLSNRVYRRLKLAAETSGGIGLLLRPCEHRSGPSWADVRLSVEPQPYGGGSAGQRLRVELIHCRGRGNGGTVELEIDDETGDVRLASKLAAATDFTRAAYRASF